MSNDELYNSLDFKELLRRYEKAKQEGSPCYLDSDEFIDIADYYLDNERLDDLMDTVEEGLRLHPDDEYLVSLKVNGLISLHRFDEARELLPLVDGAADHDAYYFKGQLAAVDGDDAAATRYFHEWLQLEREACEKMNDKREGLDRYKDAYFHIMVSFTDLGTSEHVVRSIQEWGEEYLKTFAPLDGDDNDLDIAHLCHDADLTDLEIQIYSQCLDANPYMDQGWTYLASLQHLQGMIDEAINSAENALAVNPEDPQALMIRAHTYFDRRQYENALADYLRCYDKTGDDCCLMIIGRCYIQLGRNKEGYDYLVKAREYCNTLRKDKEEQAYNRGFIADSFCIGGFYKEALSLINVVLRAFPDDVDYMMQRANILLEQGKIEDAVEEYIEASNKSGRQVQNLMIAAGTLMEKAYYRAAMVLLLLASKEKSDPEYKKTYVYIAYIGLQLGNVPLFSEVIKRACEYTPDVVNALWKNDLIGINPKDYYERLTQLYGKSDDNSNK